MALIKFLFQLLALVLLCAIGIAEVYNGDGQPGCKTQEEIIVKIYRNTWDPTRYWECVEANQTAKSVRCPEVTGFLDSAKACVNWEDWVWTPPVPPPSVPTQE